eukprot:893177-Amphidinium_carterae.1
MQLYRVKGQLITTKNLLRNLKVTMLQNISLRIHGVQYAKEQMDRLGDTESPDELKKTYILTVDLMEPFPPSYPKKFKYALVGAYRKNC